MDNTQHQNTAATAATLLARLRPCLDAGVAALAQTCAEQGKLNNDLLDARQVACFEIAWASADLLAAETVIGGLSTQTNDADALRGHILLARQLGFVGAFCVHPSQVEILNEGFAPTADEVAHARLQIEAFGRASAAGQGAIEFRGKMVDMPVVLRARELLARASNIARQEIS